MSARHEHKPRKRSLCLDGRQPSVSRDDQTFAGLRALAEKHGMSFKALAAEVDAGRAGGETLSDALRRRLATAAAAEPLFTAPST